MVNEQINFFEFFGLEPMLAIDLTFLKKAYYEKSLEVHPDHNLDSELEDSALTNLAYKTLQNENSRLKYVLEAMGGFDLEKNNKLDPMFLMDMMELNEQVESATEENQKDLEEEIQSLVSQKKEQVSPLWNKNITDWTDDDWSKLLTYYLESKYLLRVKKNLDTFASR